MFKPVCLFSCIDPILVGSHPGDIIDELDDTFDQPILHVLDNREVINATKNVTRPTQEGTMTLKKYYNISIFDCHSNNYNFVNLYCSFCVLFFK